MSGGSSRLFYTIAKNLFRLFFTLYNRLEVKGLEKVPRGVPLIVAANHASYVDPPLIGGVFPVRLRYLAKDSLFRVPLLGFLVRALGAVPVKREDGQSAGAVMKGLLSLLGSGECVLLFPEGSRSADGRLKPLEAGAAFLSVKAGVPLLPVYIDGSFKVWPKGGKFPKPSKLSLSISQPIYPDLAIRGEKERRDAARRELETALSSMEAANNVH